MADASQWWSRFASAREEPRVFVEDAELASRAAARDAAAWETIYVRFHRPVFRYVRYRVGEQAAEDVTADVFVAAVTSIEKYTGKRPLLAWLYGVARHRVADHHRRMGRRESLIGRVVSLQRSSTPSGEERDALEVLAAAASDPGQRVVQLDLAPALTRLTADQREVLVLRHFAGLTTLEIAAVLGKRVAAVYSLEARALARLRRDLDGEVLTD